MTETTTQSESRSARSSSALQALRDKVTVVIPTLNEAESIGSLLDEIASKGYSRILIVDGYSKDLTPVIARERGAEVIMQEGQGKAGAIVTAFHTVSTPYLIVMDGDGSYDPADLDKFLPLLDDYDLIKGARITNENMSGLHRLGNRIITRTFNLLFGTTIVDICSGMYLLRTEKVASLSFEKHPLTLEQEVAAQLVLSSSRITSVPINYRQRFGGTSKTRTWRQGFRDLVTNFDLARTYNPILLFSLLASLAILPAFGLLIYALVLNYAFNDYHSGYFLGSAILLVIGFQGIGVAAIAAMLRRMERKLDSFHVQ
jgi:dolichol-phosphate mannosyltransferase